MNNNIELIIIDPQNSFCDPEKGTLYVPNSENDIKNISKFIDKLGEKISKIYVSLDLHHRISIFHPLMWINKENKHPAPFTIIENSDIKNNTWYPIFPELKEKYITYCEELKRIKKQLIIWPEHCLIGSENSNVVPLLYNSILKWEEKVNNNINWITKGMSIHTEHFSIIKSIIIDKNDKSTLPNKELLKSLEQTKEQIFICGEAGSHCVSESIIDIVKESSDKRIIEKIVFLEDCVSPVSNFKILQENFIKEYKELGMKIAKTTDF